MLLEDYLIRFGLSQKQARLYLTLLELGTCKPADLAKRSRLNRSTTYVLLKELVEYGLVTQSEQRKKKIFTALAPELLPQYLTSRSKHYQRLAQQAEGIIPDLRALAKSQHTPKVNIFEGKRGLQAAYEDTLTANGKILAYASIDDMHQAMPNYFPDYYKRRAKRRIHIDAIFPNTPHAVARHRLDKQEARTALLIPVDQFQFAPEINIYNDKIAIFSWPDRLATIIESAALATAQKTIFALAWAEAQRWEKRCCPIHH